MSTIKITPNDDGTDTVHCRICGQESQHADRADAFIWGLEHHCGSEDHS